MIYELNAYQMEALDPEATTKLTQATTELLSWQYLPRRMELSTTEQSLVRGHVRLRQFDAENTGVMDIYRVKVSLVGSAIVRGRPVINQAEFFISPDDTQLSKDDFLFLARELGSVKSIDLLDTSLTTADSIMRDLGHSVMGLAQGERIGPGEHWLIHDMPADY